MARFTAIVCERSQHVVGAGSGFGGPDTYVAVQLVPLGATPLKCLNRGAAARRGIQIVCCGEGYSRSGKTIRSSLGRARAKAQSIVQEVDAANREELTLEVSAALDYCEEFGVRPEWVV